MGAIGNNIRAFRRLNKLTQQEVADAGGVARVTVAKWEKGEIDHPRPEVVEALCEAYRLKPDDLLSDHHGIAAREDTGGYDPADSNTLLLKRIANDALVNEDMRIEVPSTVARAHPFGFMLQSNIVKVTGSPAPCYVVVDPQTTFSDGDCALVSTPKNGILLARVNRGIKKTMLTPLDVSDESDLILNSEQVRILGVVVWWQSARYVS